MLQARGVGFLWPVVISTQVARVTTATGRLNIGLELVVESK